MEAPFRTNNLEEFVDGRYFQGPQNFNANGWYLYVSAGPEGSRVWISISVKHFEKSSRLFSLDLLSEQQDRFFFISSSTHNSKDEHVSRVDFHSTVMISASLRFTLRLRANLVGCKEERVVNMKLFFC